MDFTFSPEADDAAALAATILGDHTTSDRLAAAEATGRRFDPVLWKALADAGLLTLTTPEDDGGAGLGFVELCRVLVEVGRTVAPVPLATNAVARLLVVEHGTPDQLRTLHADPAAVTTCAVAEEHEHAPRRPTTTAAPADDGWVLTGTKYLVPAGTVATSFLVSATTPDGPAVLLVHTGDTGVSVAEQRTSDGDEAGLLELDAVRLPADRLVGGAGAADRLLDLLAVATCALQLGITEGALALTAEYARTREQFDRPIGTFQAVAQRLADGYIDTRCQALTLWQAAWRLAEQLPAAEAVATATLWASEAGHRVAHTTVHVHGGVGIDVDGVAHRYYTAAMRFGAVRGGGTEQALHLGRLLADAPA
ncbi:acyl-CoA dehydrogenase, C-terminal domain protein [Aeromicrobium marinum DSM 15272]|uniref:Acyl-CoA dehydrogenase, C-terminal domain protein n=1 Tax=Aeromicrobium marinum DSM 15272 TaxID=585531 RepID=E2SEK8_9ACTN|nr:acyl-CoA dehydrogenase family protein [Aeromicrobium marinum]EFQ82305.1 acyl-CoA dehydrogenase, C-terminal domain protein [Aeromicrobium marinum DSM 15272]